jgi:hypothetical protein
MPFSRVVPHPAQDPASRLHHPAIINIDIGPAMVSERANIACGSPDFHIIDVFGKQFQLFQPSGGVRASVPDNRERPFTRTTFRGQCN